MSAEQVRQVTEAESRKVAEESREAEWKQPSFMREMFLGNFRIDLIHPYPTPKLDRPEFVDFYMRQARGLPARRGRPGRHRRG